MTPETIARIEADPRYRALVRGRARLAWALTVVMLSVFFAFTLMIAFDKAALAQPIGDGVISIGIPVGLGIIVFAILLTGFYVRIANRRFDPATRALQAEYGGGDLADGGSAPEPAS